jgi:hypothetical protein
VAEATRWQEEASSRLVFAPTFSGLFPIGGSAKAKVANLLLLLTKFILTFTFFNHIFMLSFGKLRESADEMV